MHAAMSEVVVATREFDGKTDGVRLVSEKDERDGCKDRGFHADLRGTSVVQQILAF